MHPGRRQVGVWLGEGKGGYQAGCAGKFRKGEGGGAYFTNSMGIRADGAQQVMLLGEEYGFQVVLREKTAGIIHLNSVDARQDGGEVIQTPMTLAQPIERVRNRDESPLGMQQVDGLLSGQPGGDFFFHEETEQLALSSHDLFTNYEPVGSKLHGFEGTGDGVVVGDDQFLEALTIAGAQQVG